MVVTFLPETEEIGVMHERVASPLTCTVHAPQRAIPQPNFVPVRLRVSRKTQSNGISGLTSTVSGFPLRVKVMDMRTSEAYAHILHQFPAWTEMRTKRNRRISFGHGPASAKGFPNSIEHHVVYTY